MELHHHTLASVYKQYRYFAAFILILVCMFCVQKPTTPFCQDGSRSNLQYKLSRSPVTQLHQPTAVPQDEYNQFNLQNINAPIPPKWKNNENILEDFKKFKHGCMCIFYGPMAHITNDKVKTNVFNLGWT